MLKEILIISALVILGGCATPKTEPRIHSVTQIQGKGYPFGTTDQGQYLKLLHTSTLSNYAYTPENPVKAGNTDQRGSGYSIQYLNSLRGPNGEVIEYYRRGSCCPFETPNGMMGSGLLDAYVLTYKGLEKPIVIYINMYDSGQMLIPAGLTARQ